MKQTTAFTRRKALAIPFAALASKLIAGTPPNPTREAHQMALMLLLLNDTAQFNFRTAFFTQTYDAAGYANTVFGKCGIAYATFRAAQTPYKGNTPQIQQRQALLKNALSGLREQAAVMGNAIGIAANPAVAPNIYDPADPCPFGDANLNFPLIKKMTA